MDKVFLDTNVVVDFLCERGEFYLPAARIVTKAYHKEIELCCSAMTFATVSYLMEKSKVPVTEIFRKLADFSSLCTPTTIDRSVISDTLTSVAKKTKPSPKTRKFMEEMEKHKLECR